MRHGYRILILTIGLVVLASVSAAQPHPGQPGRGGFGPGGEDGRGRSGERGPGGMDDRRPPQPGQIMPSFVQEALKLSPEQRRQVDDLQREVDERLARILTDDQRRQLKTLRSRARRPGFEGGRPGGEIGRPGFQGGRPPGGGGRFGGEGDGPGGEGGRPGQPPRNGERPERPDGP